MKHIWDDVESNALYECIWELWGPSHQMNVCLEELLEMGHEILKAKRNNMLFTEEFLEEFADVKICVEQVELMLKKRNMYQSVEKYRFDKLTRLYNRYIGGKDV